MDTAKIDYHKNNATRRLTALKESLEIVFRGLNYLDGQNSGDDNLPGFMVSIMVGYMGHIESALGSVEKLHEAADPNQPEDLPF